jgi:hypothetical protein
LHGGLDETRTRRTITAKRVPNMPTHHRHVPVHIDTVFIEFPSQTNPYQSSEQQVETLSDGTGETYRTKITSCMEGWTKRAPVAQTLQSVRQTCPCTTATCPCTLIRFSLNSRVKPTPTSPVNNKLKHQVTAPVKPTERKLRVAWRGLDETRTRRTNTA